MDTKLEVECESNNCTSVRSPGANIASPIAMSLFGIIGNTIALVLIHQMKLERQRTVFFVFVAGLAFADLVGQVLTTIPVILVYIHGYYIGGSVMCNYHAFTMIMISILTPMIACAMAMERYFGIHHGYFYMLHFNPYRARVTLLSLWLIAILFASLPVFGFGQYAIQYPGTWCFLNLHPKTSVDSAYSILSASLNLFFIAVMIVCNIAVQCTLIALRCQRSSADRADRFRRTHRSPQQEELEVQMLFVLFAITLAFTVCWTPLQIQILMNQFYEHKTAADHAGDLLAVRLASINQIVDPWVYILCKKLCFRRGCTCWSFIVQNKWDNIHRSFSQREANGSSLRSALQFRAQSARTSRRCSRCLVKNADEIPLQQLTATGNAAFAMEEGIMTSLSNPVSSTAIIGNDSAKSNSSGQQVNQHSSAEITNTESSASNDVIPIPIFTSSQYSIHRRRRARSNPRGANKRRILSPTTQLRHNQNTTAGTRLFSFQSDVGTDCWDLYGAGRRRHSWCCSRATQSTRYVTQSTQTFLGT